jgi:putative nucleotidyltransferase with HDIG domain
MSLVLVVDDEKNILAAFRDFLEEDGHVVHTSDEAKSALRLLRDQEYDVVVSDILMPGMSGLDLLSEIREISETVQVIMITGQPTVENAMQAVRSGAYDYIPKPVSGNSIRKAVAQAARVAVLREEKLRLEMENRRYQQHLERIVEERTAELYVTNKELHLVNETLRKSIDGIVQAISLTIEKRDPHTAGHQFRVAALAKKIAEEMNLSSEAINGISVAGVLHDIGKTTIPAELLVKPERLTPEEFMLVKRHPVAGWEILKNISFPWPIDKIVLQHHERLDGSGYPDGIKSGDMLIEAKVLAVADVVEAMSQHRTYRPALSIETALEEIASKKDAHYDPDVVEACIRLFREKGFKFPEPGTSTVL